eukprot:1839901-Lingulodinium_polyedra.AAC.1
MRERAGDRICGASISGQLRASVVSVPFASGVPMPLRASKPHVTCFTPHCLQIISHCTGREVKAAFVLA